MLTCFSELSFRVLRMFTGINILATLNHALSPSKTTISNVILSSEEIESKNEIRFFSCFYHVEQTFLSGIDIY